MSKQISNLFNAIIQRITNAIIPRRSEIFLASFRVNRMNKNILQNWILPASHLPISILETVKLNE